MSEKFVELFAEVLKGDQAETIVGLLELLSRPERHRNMDLIQNLIREAVDN
jgi:hypothetical protein